KGRIGKALGDRRKDRLEPRRAAAAVGCSVASWTVDVCRRADDAEERLRCLGCHVSVGEPAPAQNERNIFGGRPQPIAIGRWRLSFVLGSVRRCIQRRKIDCSASLFNCGETGNPNIRQWPAHLRALPWIPCGCDETRLRRWLVLDAVERRGGRSKMLAA